ncbi:MAG TPA: SIMPL domain-containing protein [Methanocorpusculum sp.]|nr:SIMPL domain-containing protein [Candidatus Methanocorpusculum equi]MCQ2357950.1 SIMPL domain-containing protein [Methanocorpusculum sp.]HJJ33594.1 SIMPL domain-containing protein [Methanocorpusculum sp.]HJJ45029.1 SIMPL domain-containing protein [Methanocorpusculum sp.]HJJ58879.1 SIMPL domain-containing protein [Methanocorpusculum sp.]
MDTKYKIEQANLCVSGVGISHVKPDRFTLTISIGLEHPDDDLIFKTVSARTVKLLQALKSWAKDGDSIRTSSFNMGHYEYNKKNGKWAIGQMIATVTTYIYVDSPRVDEVSKLVTLAKQSGATSIRSIEFKLSDALRLKERENALKNAVAAARLDASVTASAMGVSLVKVLKIDVDSGYSHDTYSRGLEYSCESSSSFNADDDMDCPEFIECGEVATHVRVVVIYGISE